MWSLLFWITGSNFVEKNNHFIFHNIKCLGFLAVFSWFRLTVTVVPALHWWNLKLTIIVDFNRGNFLHSKIIACPTLFYFAHKNVNMVWTEIILNKMCVKKPMVIVIFFQSTHLYCIFQEKLLFVRSYVIPTEKVGKHSQT